MRKEEAGHNICSPNSLYSTTTLSVRPVAFRSLALLCFILLLFATFALLSPRRSAFSSPCRSSANRCCRNCSDTKFLSWSQIQSTHWPHERCSTKGETTMLEAARNHLKPWKQVHPSTRQRLPVGPPPNKPQRTLGSPRHKHLRVSRMMNTTSLALAQARFALRSGGVDIVAGVAKDKDYPTALSQTLQQGRIRLRHLCGVLNKSPAQKHNIRTYSLRSLHRLGLVQDDLRCSPQMALAPPLIVQSRPTRLS
jgi:hypothetical protein